MKFKFCPYCGLALIKKPIGDEGLVPYCDQCKIPIFDIPYACTITIAVNEFNEAALIKQNYVNTESYVCIAGYIKSGENAEYTATREVAEEIGITPEFVSYLGSYYFEKKDMLILGFSARVKKSEFVLSGEVDSAQWFPLDVAIAKVPKGSIAQQLIFDYIKSISENKSSE